MGYCELYFKNGVHYININNDIVSIVGRLIMEIYVFDLISLTKFVPINIVRKERIMNYSIVQIFKCYKPSFH